MREITDASVIISIVFLVYMVVAHWGEVLFPERVFGTQFEKSSFLYFLSVALIVFSVRRIVDQRRERIKRVAAEEHAYVVSTRDPLTQLPNLRHFQSDLNAAASSNNIISVLLLGLDQFKKLNQVYGHVGCDEALSQISSRLRDCTKSGDILARVGDDEFAFCLAG